MFKRYRQRVNFEREIQPLVQSSSALQAQAFDFPLQRLLVATREGGSVLLDLRQEDGPTANNLTQLLKPHLLVKLIQSANDFGSAKKQRQQTCLQLFDCQVEVVCEDKLMVVGVLHNPEERARVTHLLTLFMKHVLCQMESEFTPKLLREDLPRCEAADLAKLLYYQQIFGIYNQLPLGELVRGFGRYIRDLLQGVIAHSKARYLASYLVVLEGQDLLLSHSFVKDSARYLNFTCSRRFLNFLENFQLNKKRIKEKSLLQDQRRRSVLSNYKNRTYNKETIQELSFGPFILKASTLKTPLER